MGVNVRMRYERCSAWWTDPNLLPPMTPAPYIRRYTYVYHGRTKNDAETTDTTSDTNENRR